MSNHEFESLDPLTENFVVLAYVDHLQSNGWNIRGCCIGREHGIDIDAEKDGVCLFIEAKGAKGNPNDASVVRSIFDSGQIRDHLGKAIVKAAELKFTHPNARVEILHPNTEAIRKIVDPVSEAIKAVGIKFVFLDASGKVVEQLPSETKSGSGDKFADQDSDCERIEVDLYVLEQQIDNARHLAEMHPDKQLFLETNDSTFQFEIEHVTATRIQNIQDQIRDGRVYLRSLTRSGHKTKNQYNTQFGGCYVVETKYGFSERTNRHIPYSET